MMIEKAIKEAQHMYSAESLARYPFFRDLLQTTPLPTVHDSLTGLVARPFILRFIHALIDEKTPFVMGMIDLDNFKSINDNYGHRTGDRMLSRVAEDLRSFMGEDGVVGRYGGDEFLFVYFGCTDYDGIHAFLDEMYLSGRMFRKDLKFDGRTIFSTATVGCAVYPTDADSFDGLFALADKTLYRGKSKGRNCFIIYVPAKHDKLEIPTLARRNLYDTFFRTARGFDAGSDTMDCLRRAFVPIRENMRMYRLFFLDTENRLQDVTGGGEPEPVESPEELIHNGLFAAHSLEELESHCPKLFAHINALEYQSLMISKVEKAERSYGYLLFCPEVLTFHIWQESECALAFFLSHLLADYLEGHGE